MFQRLRFLIPICVLFSLAFGANISRAQSSLPALPSQSVINQVLAGGGPVYVTTGVPDKVDKVFKSAFKKFKPFKDGQKQLDYGHAASYFSLSSTVLRTLIPLSGASQMTLQSDIQTPDNQPAKLLGGEYDATTGATLVLLVNGSQLRFYTSDSTYTAPFGYISHQLPSVTTGDLGVSIATNEACYEIGNNLACFNPNGTGVDGSAAASTQAAYNQLAAAFSFSVSFDFSASVTDRVGAAARAQCTGADNCQPNAVYVASGATGQGQIIGLLNVLATNDLKTYDINGRFVGQLLPDAYLVIQATSGGAGSAGALFLVGAKNHTYLIPALGFNGYGNGSNKAAIKDASMGGWMF